MKRILISAMLAAAAILGVLATQGSAHTKSFPTSTTVVATPRPGSQTNGTYSGTVSSSNPRCVAGRRVAVDASGGPLAIVTTDAAGNWRTPDVVLGAEEIIVFQKKLVKSKRHKHICRQAQVTTSPGT